MHALLKTPFSFASTTHDVLRDVDLSGQRAIVTGASSGIGAETARALASTGAEVTLAVRNVQAGNVVAARISAAVPHARLDVRLLDLSDQASVRAFAQAWRGPLHILVNNAGVMALPTLERTAEGWEMQFATNFMGHFNLACGLHAALTAAEGARIVSLSSSASLLSPVLFDDLAFRFMPYTPFVAYGQSKTACTLFAVAATRNWYSDGIFANALNPGAIATHLQRHTGGLQTPPEQRKSIEQGAATTALLAGSALLNGVGGLYFEDCNEAPVVHERSTEFRGVAPYALNPANAERLWNVAGELLDRAGQRAHT